MQSFKVFYVLSNWQRESRIINLCMCVCVCVFHGLCYSNRINGSSRSFFMGRKMLILFPTRLLLLFSLELSSLQWGPAMLNEFRIIFCSWSFFLFRFVLFCFQDMKNISIRTLHTMNWKKYRRNKKLIIQLWSAS